MTSLTSEFWNRMEDVRACMLGISDQEAFVPMSPQVDDDVPGHVWFITAKGTALAQATSKGDVAARMIVSDNANGIYADVRGQLTHSTDRDALDEVWSLVAGAWFEGGQTDPDVCLLRFTPEAADMSITSGGGAKFLYEVAKAHIIGDTPDMGQQGKVVF